MLGIRSVAKTFVGDLIEAARRVQGEWIEKTGEAQAEYSHPSMNKDRSNDASGDMRRDGVIAVKNGDQNAPRGPLRPEHLVEAWRRYKLEYGGGAVGVQGLWHLQQHDGVERFNLRANGKVLFK